MVIRYVVAIAIIGLSGAYAGQLQTGTTVSGKTPELEQLPRDLSGWHGEGLSAIDQEAETLAADATLHRRYRRRDGVDVWLSIAYFAKQQVNSQIHSPRNCLPGVGWRVVSIEQKRLRTNEGEYPATRMLIAKKERRQEVFYWFRTAGGTIAGEYALKWDLVKRSLARQPTNAAFVRFNGQPSDSGALHEIMDLLKPHLDQILSEVGL
jgi:EpsI family protein